jgi:hypothetical protein
MKPLEASFRIEGDVQTEIDDSRLLMMWTAVTALTLFCATTVAAFGGRVPDAFGHTGISPSPAANAMWRTNAIQPSAAQLDPAIFLVPAAHTEVNATPNITKG